MLFEGGDLGFYFEIIICTYIKVRKQCVTFDGYHSSICSSAMRNCMLHRANPSVCAPHLSMQHIFGEPVTSGAVLGIWGCSDGQE